MALILSSRSMLISVLTSAVSSFIRAAISWPA